MGGHRDRMANSQGSWFSSGYYGHFRSKHRNDFLNQYRQQSKPSPPHKFHDMISDRPTSHHFSNHDNRFSFLNTVTSFEGSLGKRKVQGTQSKSKFVPDFIAWVPHKREIEAAGPKVSIYRDTFNGSGDASSGVPVPQVLVSNVTSRQPRPPETLHRPLIHTPYLDHKTAEEEMEPLSTTYQLTHRHRQPNRLINTDMNTGVVSEEPVPDQKTMSFINPRVASIHERPVQSMTALRRSRVSSAPIFRSSVADCMVWHSHGEDQQVRMLPTEPPRPKTATGMLPVISNSDTNQGNSSAQGSFQPVQVMSEPSRTSHYNITPSATAMVPMETMQMSASQPEPMDLRTSFSHAPLQPPEAPQAMVSESI